MLKRLAFFLFLASQSSAFVPNGLFQRLHYLEPPTGNETSKIKAEEEYFTQRLDHFDALNTDTWSQRYFSSFEFYEEGGPAFLFIGGEGPGISDRWLNTGAWLEWARKEKAALFILEHRYYGKSQPKPTLTTEEMKWLSSRQALNDLAVFVEAMTEKYGLTGPWISTGGSYPGSLAAWAREKYPHLIKGSVSSSGPLLAKVNFFEYLEVVYAAMGKNGDVCNTAITEAIMEIEGMIDSNDYSGLEESFMLCSPLDATIEEDVANFLASLVGILQGAVQYDFNGPINVDDVCNIMENEEYGSSLNRMMELNKYYLKLNNAPCLDHTYQSFIDYLSQLEYGMTGGYRQWIYQTCTEFGWYQSSDQPSGAYGTKFPVEFSLKGCRDLFGDIFTDEYVQEMIDESNAYFGATDLDVDRVVFVHGSIDPWSAMGRLTDLNENAPAFIIPGSSHCTDLYSNKAGDSQELIDIRAKIADLVSQWVNE